MDTPLTYPHPSKWDVLWWVWNESGITDDVVQHVALAITIGWYNANEGKAWPTLDQIAAKTHLGRNTVKYATAVLAESGEWSITYGPRKQKQYRPNVGVKGIYPASKAAWEQVRGQSRPTGWKHLTAPVEAAPAGPVDPVVEQPARVTADSDQLIALYRDRAQRKDDWRGIVRDLDKIGQEIATALAAGTPVDVLTLAIKRLTTYSNYTGHRGWQSALDDVTRYPGIEDSQLSGKDWARAQKNTATPTLPDRRIFALD